MGRATELEEERKGYLRLAAKGRITDDDLDAMLTDVEEQLEAVRAELRAVEDEVRTVRRIEAARKSLSSYRPVHSD